MFPFPAMKFFYLVWSNLKRKKLRTMLTLLSILVAFVLFALLAALKHAFTAGFEWRVRTACWSCTACRFLNPAGILREPHGSIPGVSAVSHQTWFNGIYKNRRISSAASRWSPELFLAMTPEISLPEDQKQAWLKTRTGAIVGRSLAERFDWKIGDRVPLKSPIWPAKRGRRLGVRHRRHIRRRQEERRHLGLLLPLRLFRRGRVPAKGWSAGITCG